MSAPSVIQEVRERISQAVDAFGTWALAQLDDPMVIGRLQSLAVVLTVIATILTILYLLRRLFTGRRVVIVEKCPDTGAEKA